MTKLESLNEITPSEKLTADLDALKDPKKLSEALKGGFETEEGSTTKELKENIEICPISDSDVPSEHGGINREGYTYAELRHQPIIPEILDKITDPEVRKLAEECNSRNRDTGFVMTKVDGEYCFSGLRVGPAVKIPDSTELKQLLSSNPQTAEALQNKEVSPDMIRKITYGLLQQELAQVCGVSVKDAAHIIGNVLDCAPHEDPSGYIFMVPNWAHNWFRHDGYVSKMLVELNR